MKGQRVEGVYASTTASRLFWNLSKAFPTFSLLKLVKAAVILAFSSSIV